MNLDAFVKQVEGVHIRLNELYKGANRSPRAISEDLLPIAFKELGIVSEELQVAIEELQRQNDELQSSQALLTAQSLRYQELFESAPESYLLTDAEGKIQEANKLVATLLNVPQRFLIGKPLSAFVAEEDKQTFYNKLNQVYRSDEIQQKWTLHIAPRNLKAFNTTLTVAKVKDWQGNTSNLRILISSNNQSSNKSPLESTVTPIKLEDNNSRTQQSPKQIFLKGEIIPVKPQTIWQVSKGVVKLSTVCENGEEVLVGLVTSDMLFGADLTSLPTYQATALSEVQLVSISPIDIAKSPDIAQVVFAQVSQRLRQTEALLAISGQRRVKDRFYQLLSLLKQEIGQPVELGTRLSVRFTHQDFADACSTTRVTITRLMGKLQDKGAIKVDTKNHIIIIHKKFEEARK
jgi:PAS domain S-box-containing protein